MTDFRLFPPCPQYRVYRDGRIESCLARGCRGPTDTWKPISPARNSGGYLQFSARIDGKRKAFLVHTAVLMSWVGPRPDGQECRHLDGDRRNNNLGNLRWGTPQENADDKKRHGTIPKGEHHWSARLSLADREDARGDHASGTTAGVVV